MYYADVIYLYFAIAFDKVLHGIQMQNKKMYIVSGDLSAWIHNFS